MKFTGSNGFLVIPTEISRDPELLKKPKSIILMGEIISMLKVKGKFYIGDEELANRLNCSTRWISDMLNFLEVNKWIKRDKIWGDGKVKRRYIFAGESLKNIRFLDEQREPQFRNHSSEQKYSSATNRSTVLEVTEVQFPRLQNCTSEKENNIREQYKRTINNNSSSHDEHSNLKNKQIENEFNILWGMYPRKQGKKQALTHYKSWRKKSPAKHTFEFMQSKINEYNKYLKVNNTPPQFIAMGSTWFNGRFEDDFNIGIPKPINKQPQISKPVNPEQAKIDKFNQEKQKEMDEMVKDLPF